MKKISMMMVGMAVGSVLCSPSVLLAQPEGEPVKGGKTIEKGDLAQKPASLIVGEAAPVFILKSLDGKSETDVSLFRGKRPIILFFGSYT